MNAGTMTNPYKSGHGRESLRTILRAAVEWVYARSFSIRMTESTGTRPSMPCVPVAGSSPNSVARRRPSSDCSAANLKYPSRSCRIIKFTELSQKLQTPSKSTTAPMLRFYPNRSRDRRRLACERQSQTLSHKKRQLEHRKAASRAGGTPAVRHFVERSALQLRTRFAN